MEDEAKGEGNMFLYSVTFGGRVGKPQRFSKKEGKEITMEKKESYISYFYLFTHFKFSSWGPKGWRDNRVRCQSRGSRTPGRPGWWHASINSWESWRKILGFPDSNSWPVSLPTWPWRSHRPPPTHRFPVLCLKSLGETAFCRGMALQAIVIQQLTAHLALLSKRIFPQ